MKIILYIDTMMHRGGAQRVMSVLANELSKRGNKVVLINDFPAKDREYEMESDVKRLFLKKYNERSFIKKNILRIIKLRKHIKIEKPDVVISFLGRLNIRMILACCGLKTKKIISVRNDPMHEYGIQGIKKKLVNFIYGYSDGIVFQTADERDYFSEKIKNKSTIILNPIDERFYNVKRQDKLKNIVSIGRLEEQKNHRLLIDAFAQIKDRFPYENLFIYGEGNQREELDDYVRNKGLTDRVFLAGNVENVSEILSGAKIFVMSSIYEGLPNALMEAMAVGMPCISTDCPCGGPKLLIDNESLGRLVKCEDVSDMADAISACLDNSELREIYSKNSKIKALLFKKEEIINQWEEYINRCCGV